MFKLKKLELQGFKSFADRTRLEFGQGTAAIVGPNGCGKSNLGDAINWVLGEQSAKTLRGDRMADVIFNGTRLRPATSMAEVSLTLINPEADELPSKQVERHPDPDNSSSSENAPSHDADQARVPSGVSGDRADGDGSEEPPRLMFRDSEIVITRRLFRSGESEYLINGDTCRLRDIQELFMGTGLGPDSYAIIEQGRIGQILSSKPSDRRAIIEEAAGVSKFRTRKRLAEAKLESARQNLARVTDILEEVSKQVGSLKRQASKARRYRELNEDLRSHLRLALLSRLALLDRECAAIREELGVVQAECNDAGRDLESLTLREKTAGEQLEELETEILGLREACAQADLERERLVSRMGQAKQQIDSLVRRRAEAATEHAALGSAIADLEQKSAERSRSASQVRAEAAQANGSVSRILSRQAELVSVLSEAERRLESCRHGLLGTVAKAAELRNQIAQSAETVTALERQAARTEWERAAAAEESLRISAELETCRSQRAATEEALSTLTRSAEEAATLVKQLQRDEEAQRIHIETLREEHSHVRARRDALGESLGRHAYSTESVRRLLSGGFNVNGSGHGNGSGNGNGNGAGRSKPSFQPLGVLADFLEVTPGYEELVEEYLKQELDCVVVERHEDARQGIDLLESEGAGRSTFFVKQMDPDGHAQAGVAAEALPGVLAPLTALVQFEPSLGINGGLALQTLAQAYVVEDAETAQRLAGEHPARHFLTTRGEHYHHRLVSGGKGPSAGPLALRREFRELDRRLAELEPVLRQARVKLEALCGRRGASEEEVRRLAAARVDAEKEAFRVAERLEQTEQSLERSRRRLELLDDELARTHTDREATRGRRATFEREIEAVAGEQASREAEITQVSEATRKLRVESDQLAQELGEAQALRRALEERSQAAEAERLDLENRLAETRTRLERLDQQFETWSSEHEALDGDTVRLAAEAEALQTRQEHDRARLAALIEESKQARRGRDELGPLVEAARARLDALRDKRSGCEVALARAESGLDHHVNLCREELGQEPGDLKAGLEPQSALVGEALDAAEAEVHELRKKIANLGPLNMMALEELQEAEQRFNFLETQRQDLLASIGDTNQAIREIDEVSHRQFNEAFEIINSNFANTFRTLFGGGTGAMRLSDESDPDSGIDLAAQPPGKKLQNVLLLSGGEKALVALALLIAIFRYTPSPFCVLDEVDAPLDDSNVERFTRMIRAMSQQTQFILMTHNKRTMEICPMMYGVTMEEPGISKLVSVRFETPQHEELLAAVSF